ncbi:Sodium/calcium exchanger membrane region [Penicillium manginii]|jgi:Ca2+:H+ antiporter|uniref:Sodium/calcium exchanger membrane region n=1 Tax=Penicillium manginii TaxID=203109 RepID=UPI0025465C6C|nr:Sodium/calcium exchanger membrane region [Penicillium manginii]KAJ5763682.1 Sodium/calcium exchanger membrane region [Penicillium manginii]
MSGNGSLNPGEHTSLLGRSPSPGYSPHQPQDHGRHHHHPNDSRAWVRWPQQVIRLTWLTLVRDYVNLLLVFVPLGMVAGFLHWNSTAIFVLNFFAIIPLASLLSFATEELAGTMGQALGGLMNATFGNAVELIVSHCSFVFLSSLFVDLSILYAPFHLPWLLTLDG